MKLLPLFLPLITRAQYIIPLNPVGPDDSYFLSCKISLGTPQQEIINVGLDTGSSPLWVGSSGCSSCAGNLFHETKSSTFSDSGAKFKIKYDDGTKFQGTVATDTVSIANMTVPNLGFGLITKAKFPQDEALVSQAVLGLAPVCCGDNPSSILDSWKHSGITHFDIYLPPSLENPGAMCVNCTVNPGNFTTIPVTLTDEAWNSPKAKLETTSGVAISPLSYPGYFDTGSDLIYTPKTVFKAWCKNLGWTVEGTDCTGPCSQVKTFANYTVNFSGVKLTLNTQDYLTYKYEGATCALSAVSNSDRDGWTFGVAFIRQFYTVWDWGAQPSVSFAQRT